jgi:hypothetical protein
MSVETTIVCYESLPREIITLILAEIDWSIVRAINKFNRLVADKRKFDNDDPIIIKKHSLIEYLLTMPNFIAYTVLSQYSNYHYQYIKVAGTYKYWYYDEGEWIFRYTVDYSDFKMMVLTDFEYSQKEMFNFIPGIDIIKYFLEKHPFSYNRKFVDKKIRVSLENYIVKLKCEDATIYLDYNTPKSK